MMDQLLDSIVTKAVDYCSIEENRKKIIKPLEESIGIRFMWIVRCFEVIASLAMVQTILLVWILFLVRRPGGS